MTDAPRSDETTVEDALEALESAVESGEVSTEIYDDDSAMTPMLVVEFDRHTDRADVLRTLFHADGPVKVDSVHDHRAVVRAD